MSNVCLECASNPHHIMCSKSTYTWEVTNNCSDCAQLNDILNSARKYIVGAHHKDGCRFPPCKCGKEDFMNKLNAFDKRKPTLHKAED